MLHLRSSSLSLSSTATFESGESSSTGEYPIPPITLPQERREAHVYRDRLRAALLMHHHTLEVDLKDLIVWNDELAQKVQEQPGEMVPLVSFAPLPHKRPLS